MESHPFYVTVTEVNYNRKERSLEISSRIFTDDLEKALRKKYKSHVDLLASNEDKAMNSLVEKYLSGHLSIKTDGKPLVLKFIGYEKDEEAVRCYLEVSDADAFKKIEITDNILYDYYPSQESIVHVRLDGNRKSARLVNPDDRFIFRF